MRVIGLEQTVYDVREDMGGVVVCVSRWGDTGCLESNFSITLRTVATSAGVVQKTDAIAVLISLLLCTLSIDYTTEYGAVHPMEFDRCQLKRCVYIQITNDDAVEKDESFNITLELTSSQDIVVDKDHMNATINVQDDDRELFLYKYMYIKVVRSVEAVIGLEKTYYPVSEGTIGDVEICVTVYRPSLGCPIQFPFTLILKALDGTAGM